MQCDTVWRGARLAAMTDPALGLIDDGMIAARGETIVYAGPAAMPPG